MKHQTMNFLSKETTEEDDLLNMQITGIDQHAKQYEALFSGGTMNSSWCRMPQHSKLNFAIKHKAWHYIDNIQNKLLTQEYLSRVTIYF